MTADLKKQIASLNSELENANAQRGGLQTKLDEATLELKSVRSTLESAQSRVGTTQSELESAKQAADQARAQAEELKKRADEMGEEGMLAAQNEWAELIAAVKSEMEKGSDPRSPEVRALARRWNDLIARFTGGNPEIAASLKNMYENEGAQSASRGMVDPEMMAFITEGCRE